jgi:hypothetical protein
MFGLVVGVMTVKAIGFSPNELMKFKTSDMDK